MTTCPGNPRGQADASPPPTCPRTWEEFKRLKRQIVEDLERRFLVAALDRCSQNVTQAAESVGMQRTNFHALLRHHGLKPELGQDKHASDRVDRP